MKYIAAATSAIIMGLLSGLAQAQCECSHNNDAGRWKDEEKPSHRLEELCRDGGACFDNGNAGQMCVLGDTSECLCAIEAAKDWESQHGDWFLWSALSCGNLAVTIGPANE